MDPISEVVWPYFVSLFIGIIIVVIFFEKKRVAKLESIAKDLGFEFTASGRSTTLSDHKNFELFHKGRDRKVSKELWRALNGNDFRMFVYSYREDGGNNSTCTNTVLSIRCNRLDAPALSLQPKRKRLMMVPDVGQYDAGFKMTSSLSQSYVIKGTDEIKIRDFFKLGVISFFEATPGFHLEAQGDTLILYNSSQRSGYCDVEKLYAQGQELLSELIG